jgi:hypothetical protein
MPKERTPNEPTEGPVSYELWKAVLNGAATPAAVEYAVMTDTTIYGEDPHGYGPFRLLNTIAGTGRIGESRPAVALSVELPEPREPDLSPMDRTDTTRYHGGWLLDEITALVSLELGIRLKPGQMIRDFRFGNDPRGQPRQFEGERNPIILTSGRSAIMPHSAGERNLSEVVLLKTLPSLKPGSAVALVRAARLYQDALWIAEGEPHLAWVMFVSAIEAAAQYWKVEDTSPVDLLKEADESLYRLLRDEGSEQLTSKVAKKIARLLGARKKFVGFILCDDHFSDPPLKRPPEAAQYRWTPETIESSLRIIYDHRSRALHDGTPFPPAMCEPPWTYGDGSHPPEIPHGLAHRTKGGTWLHKDTPMLLHTFEYIVRQTMLNWWRSMLPSS